MKKLARILLGVVALSALLSSAGVGATQTFVSSSPGSSGGNWYVTLPSRGHFASTVTRPNTNNSYANAFVLNLNTSPTTQLYFVEVSPSTGTSAYASAYASAGNYVVVHNVYGGGASSTTVSW